MIFISFSFTYYPTLADSDADGVFDSHEDINYNGNINDDDSDYDTIPNYLDNDDDNDGVLTIYETPDQDGDGNPVDAQDTDGDGAPDYLDVDDDGDLVNTEFENLSIDTDLDSTLDYLDVDDDGDTILTIYENTDPNADGNPSDSSDFDGDGTPDYLDVDDDGDSVDTKFENPDLNGWGYPDPSQDTDIDGIPDYMDIDDDNDGVNTEFENPDPNNDGNPDDALDSELNGIPDYLQFEFDDDSDTVLNSSEDLNNNGNLNDDDTDGDGISNYLDNDDDNDSILTIHEKSLYYFIDSDVDTIPNYLDNDDDNDGILTFFENPDPNNDGNPNDALDDNGNGLVNYLEGGNIIINKLIDLDYDGICDSSSNYYMYVSVSPNVSKVTSIAAGTHTISLPVNTYTVNLHTNLSSYFNVSPTSFTANLNSGTVTQDVCVTIANPANDMLIYLYPSSPARPGFVSTYYVAIRNVGTTMQSGSFTIDFDDSVIDFISATPANSSLTTNQLTFTYNNLMPMQNHYYRVAFDLNTPIDTPSLNAGDTLTFSAVVTGTGIDANSSNNSYLLTQDVVNSYDPNDVVCIEGESIDPSQVGEYVTYRIRFENTGTYFAQNIKVENPVDLTKFDINSFELISSSHTVIPVIRNNQIDFLFQNINLDFNDATNDGFLFYKIKTLPSLVLGDTFSNSASIFFDFNAPIVTNTYITTVQSLSTSNFEDINYSVYPNPFTNTLQIESNTTFKTMELYDILGKKIINQPFVNQLNTSKLAQGIYFLRLLTEGGEVLVMKVVKK